METAVLRGATEALSQGFISGFCSPSILWESLRTWERSQVMAKPINLLNVYPLNPLQDPPGHSLCHDHLCVQNFALRSVQFKCMLKLIQIQEEVLQVSIWNIEVVRKANLFSQYSLCQRARVSRNQMEDWTAQDFFVQEDLSSFCFLFF